jgi:hypothetical protein
MLTKIYAALGAALIFGYVSTSLLGWEWGNPERQMIPASARQSPGGYRSFHFWHSGYHGGK